MMSSDEEAAAEMMLLDLLEEDPCRTVAQFERLVFERINVVVPTKWVRSTFMRLVVVWRTRAPVCVGYNADRDLLVSVVCVCCCLCVSCCVCSWSVSKKLNYRRAVNKFTSANLARWQAYVAWAVEVPLGRLKYLDEVHCSNKGLLHASCVMCLCWCAHLSGGVICRRNGVDLQRTHGYAPAGERLESKGATIFGDQTYSVTALTTLTGARPIFISPPRHGSNSSSDFMRFICAVIEQGEPNRTACARRVLPPC